MSTSTLASLSGELGLIGLFDLGQLLVLNGATGRLIIHQGNKRVFLIFEEGRIINAVDDESRNGENAAYKIFTFKSGRFEFRPERPGSPRTIDITTEALMLEAARRIDEANEGVEEEGGEAAKLLNRRGAMEELRDVFHRLAREAKHVGLAATEPADLLLEELRDVDDRLYCRRGRSPRIFHDGSWLTAGETMGTSVYDDLRARVAPKVAPIVPEPSGVTRLVTIEDGRQVAVTRLGEGVDEALWIRLIALPAPDPSLLDGAWERLHPIVDLPQGVILAAGPNAEAVERLLHALVGLIDRRRAATALLVTHAAIYSHDATEGLILQVAPIAALDLLRAVQPGVAAFEPSAWEPETVREALRTTPLVLFGLVSSEREETLDRWLAALPATDRESARAVLRSRPWGIVHSEGVPMGQERIPFMAAMAVPESASDTARRRTT